MSIDRQYGMIIFICESCDEELRTGASEWPEARAMLTAKGWKPEKVGQDWVHLCPDCVERERRHNG